MDCECLLAGGKRVNAVQAEAVTDVSSVVELLFGKVTEIPTHEIVVSLRHLSIRILPE